MPPPSPPPPVVTGITHHSHHLTNEKVFALVAAEDWRTRCLLDVGAGEGYFVALLGEYLTQQGLDPAASLAACDLNPDVFKYRPVACRRLEPGGRLPFDDASFDLVTCIEVVEHVENQFTLARELLRVCRPGGRAFLTTPNVLNINSRLRYLHSGFTLLFDILPLEKEERFFLAGHIHPVSFYYLAYAFRRAGFRDLRVHFDLTKRAALPWTILLYPYLLIWNAGFRLHMKRKYPALYQENLPLLRETNRWGMLTSRSLILEALK